MSGSIVVKGPGGSGTPTEQSKFLWLDGKPVARINELVRGWAQSEGQSDHRSMRIAGPTATDAERHAARKRGMALPTRVYMTVNLVKVSACGEPDAWRCEVINPKNLDDYLRWFPQLSLRAGDV